MALDYRKCAEEIFANLGGKDNIISAAHCATRLRLVIADNSKINKEALEEVEGVQGMFDSNGQLQLIIGTGTVNKVYDEFLAVTGLTAASKADVKAAAASRMPLWKQILKTPGDIFVPILPAIVASGLMMGIVEAIPKFAPAFGETDWFSFLDLVANTAFALLPVLVAISAARVFGGNIFLGAVIGLMMVHPALINAWTVGNYAAGEIPTWKLGPFTVQQVGYQGHVIPVILAVLLMCTIEKWLHKHVPEMIDLFVTPLCTVVLTAFITFTITCLLRIRELGTFRSTVADHGRLWCRCGDHGCDLSLDGCHGSASHVQRHRGWYDRKGWLKHLDADRICCKLCTVRCLPCGCT